MNLTQITTAAIRSVVLLVLAGVIVRVIAHLLRKLELGPKANNQHRVTLYRLLSSVVRYTADFIVVVMILAQFHVQTASLIAGAGILGLAISFGAQGLVQDIVTGIFLLYEDQFGVGDNVTFPALTLSGQVQEVGIRITRLIGPAGDTIVIPNRLILEVENQSRLNRDSLTVSVVVPVSVQEDPQQVRSALEDALNAAQTKAPQASLVGITAFGNAATSWTITALATPDSQAIVDQWIRECVVDSFHRHAIHLA